MTRISPQQHGPPQGSEIVPSIALQAALPSVARPAALPFSRRTCRAGSCLPSELLLKFLPPSHRTLAAHCIGRPEVGTWRLQPRLLLTQRLRGRGALSGRRLLAARAPYLALRRRGLRLRALPARRDDAQDVKDVLLERPALAVTFTLAPLRKLGPRTLGGELASGGLRRASGRGGLRTRARLGPRRGGSNGAADLSGAVRGPRAAAPPGIRQRRPSAACHAGRPLRPSRRPPTRCQGLSP